MKIYKPIDINISLDLLMDFNLESGLGTACLSIETPNPIKIKGQYVLFSSLVTLYYARIMYAHKETRERLFEYVDHAADKLMDGENDFDWGTWSLEVFGKDYYIWPWKFVKPGELNQRFKYNVKLVGTKLEKLGLYVDMNLGMEKILAPSSVLLIIFFFACYDNIAPAFTEQLGAFLKLMNIYYKKNNMKIKIFSEKRGFKEILSVYKERIKQLENE